MSQQGDARARRTGEVLAALAEFGFGLGGPGEHSPPTPGRIADRLFDIAEDLESAASRGDGPALAAAIARLRRLQEALGIYATPYDKGEGK